MSGIAGLFYRDGRQAQPADVGGALAVFAARKPDESRIWCERGVVLACAQRRATPQSRRERLPLNDPEHGLTVVHDARLDNRAELARELGLRGLPPDEVGDGVLLLAAWRRWGERCPEHLLGDFAFAVWDERRTEMFLARDHVGMRLLYWFEEPRLVAFASQIRSLTALPGVPRRVEPARVADYMVGAVCEPAISFHAGIARLLPAQSLLLSRDATRSRRYFHLTLPEETHSGTPEEVAAGFRAVLDVAVRDRLEAADPAGSMLSGGLDSSALVCLARAQRQAAGGAALPTFSLFFPHTPGADERRFITALVDQGGIEPHYIDADAISPLQDLEDILTAVDEPFHGAPFPYQWATYRAANDCGVGVLLDGNGGDAVVCHGYFFLADLLRRLRLARLLREIKGLTRAYGLGGARFLMEFAVMPNVPAWARRLRRAIIGRAPELPPASLLAPDLAERTRIRERYTAFWHRRDLPRGDREHHLANILDSLPKDGLEKAANAFSVDQRCPFYDLRVIEYCLRVPSEHKIEDGLTRMLTRRGLRDLLPPLIAGRPGKGAPIVSLVRGLLGKDRERLADLILSSESDSYSCYLDMAGLRRLLHHYLSQPLDMERTTPSADRWREIDQIRKAAVLLQWLRATRITE